MNAIQPVYGNYCTKLFCSAFVTMVTSLNSVLICLKIDDSKPHLPSLGLGNSMIASTQATRICTCSAISYRTLIDLLQNTTKADSLMIGLNSIART